MGFWLCLEKNLIPGQTAEVIREPQIVSISGQGPDLFVSSKKLRDKTSDKSQLKQPPAARSAPPECQPCFGEALIVSVCGKMKIKYF